MRVVFKSNPENYAKELSGVKSNTLRKVDMDDERFKALKAGKATMIKIKKVGTHDWFYRTITDVTFWEGWCIISWIHPLRDLEEVDKEVNDERKT